MGTTVSHSLSYNAGYPTNPLTDCTCLYDAARHFNSDSQYSGIHWCDSCTIVYSRDPGSGLVDMRRHYNSGLGARFVNEPIIASFPVGVWDPAKFILTGKVTSLYKDVFISEPGHMCNSTCKKNSGYKEKIPGNKPETSLSTPLNQLNDKIRDTEKLTTRKLYEEAYWKFVKSVTYDDAKYWLEQMMSKVTMELEPAEGWSSWVADPVTEKDGVAILGHLGSISFFIISGIILILTVLVSTGVI